MDYWRIRVRAIVSCGARETCSRTQIISTTMGSAVAHVSALVTLSVCASVPNTRKCPSNEPERILQLLRQVMCPCSMFNLPQQGFTTLTNNNSECHSKCNNYNKGRLSTIKYHKNNSKIFTQHIVPAYTLLRTNNTPHPFLHYLKGESLHGKK